METKPNHFLTMMEFSNQSLENLLGLASRMKRSPGRFKMVLEGQCLAMIFDKSSTRTRVSFDVGMTQLGGKALLLNGSEMQWGRGEPVADTARVLSRYVQGIMIRTFSHQGVEELAAYSSVPVINGLTDSHHPCQVLADLQTIRENFRKLKGLQLVYVGDGNNMAHSLMIGAAKTGMHCRVVCPPGYQPEKGVVSLAQKEGSKTGARIEVVHKVSGSARGADVLYTDVWTSMGQEAERQKRLRAFKGFQVDERLMAESPKSIFLHCLPAHRGEEVSAGVMDGKRSRVWDQAENRLHAQKALLATLMGN